MVTLIDRTDRRDDRLLAAHRRRRARHRVRGAAAADPARRGAGARRQEGHQGRGPRAAARAPRASRRPRSTTSRSATRSASTARPVGLGRIAAQTAKQVLYQKVREAERDNVYNEYFPKVGELMNGTVKRFERGDMIVDLGKSEAIIPRDQQSRAERYGQGERIRAILYDVHKNPKGPQLVLSRTDPRLLIRLFEMEVPGDLRRHGRHQGRRAPARRARQGRGALARAGRRPGRRVRRHARQPRPVDHARAPRREDRRHPLLGRPDHVRAERARAGQDHARLADPPRGRRR